jgi:hypothetical protein
VFRNSHFQANQPKAVFPGGKTLAKKDGLYEKSEAAMPFE